MSGTGTFRPVHSENVAEHRMPRRIVFPISEGAIAKIDNESASWRWGRLAFVSWNPRVAKTAKLVAQNRIDRSVRLSAVSIPACRSSLHQFSPAALDLAVAGERLCGRKFFCERTTKRFAKAIGFTVTAIACDPLNSTTNGHELLKD